ncbi:hypothetical protein C8R46DRAFT_1209540 [Mycena filopes]|nr:hypothetical protein C8R46DRAFT_1209540 [Mycena filopes]
MGLQLWKWFYEDRRNRETQTTTFPPGPTVCPPRQPSPQPPKLKHPRLNTTVTGQEVQRQGPARFDNVPLEIFSEFLRGLHPRDLLQLARTSKPLRKILMTSDSRRLWLRALSKVPGLPKLPDTFPGPLVTYLLFEFRCTTCAKTLPLNVQIDWDLRVRLCLRCQGSRMIRSNNETASLPVASGTTRTRVRDVINTRPPGRLKFDESSVELNSESLAFGFAYLRSDLEKMKALLLEIHDSGLDQFVGERKKVLSESRIETLLQFARECRAWEAKIVEEKKLADARIRVVREAAIRAKLYSMGWGEQLAVMGPGSELSQHPLVTKAVELTDDEWITIAPRIESIMEKRRHKEAEKTQMRLEKEFKARFAAGERSHGRQRQ